MLNVTVLPLIVLVPCVDDALWTMNIFGTGSTTTACVTGPPLPLVAVSVNVIGSPGLAVTRSAILVKVRVLVPGGGDPPPTPPGGVSSSVAVLFEGLRSGVAGGEATVAVLMRWPVAVAEMLARIV